jgi:hypothetical protein
VNDDATTLDRIAELALELQRLDATRCLFATPGENNERLLAHLRDQRQKVCDEIAKLWQQLGEERADG